MKISIYKLCRERQDFCVAEYDLKLKMEEDMPLRDVVFQTLREGILTGELKPGERLMEIHLANRLGVSRTPVREAIRMLELEGLVTMIPRKGACVASISKQDLQDVLELRRALDSLAVKLACERILPEQLRALQDAAKEFEQSTVSNNAKEIAQADVRFHDIILEATGNKRLIQMVNNLAERVFRYRLEYIKDRNNHAQLVKEHAKILEYIEKKDSEAAQRAIELHIDNQEKNINLSLEK